MFSRCAATADAKELFCEASSITLVRGQPANKYAWSSK